MEKVFLNVYRFFEKHRPVFFIIFSLSFLFIAWFALQVRFEEDISKILPKDKKIEKLNQVFQDSKFIDRLVVIVSLKDTLVEQPEALVAYADQFSTGIQQKLGPYIRKVNGRVDDELVINLFSTIGDQLPVYLNEKDYQQIDALITPAGVKASLQQHLRTLTAPSGIAMKEMISNDPVGISFLALQKLQQLQYDENFELYDGYIITKDHKTLMLFITPEFAPGNTGKNVLLLKGLDSIINSLDTPEYKKVTASYFGATAVSVGNALTLRKDTILTQGIIVVFLIVFLGFYFRQKRAPVVILMPVLFGALFSLTVIYFIQGSISVIALGTGSVILGIAVNYSLHVFNHHRHTKRIEQVIIDLARPLTVGSLTTIGGFLCLEFAESEMLKDLGLFAAMSLIGAIICSLLFLPHFIRTAKTSTLHQPERSSWIDKIAAYQPEYNKYFVFAIFLLTGVFAHTARNISFESDMMNMNYMSGKLRDAEAKLNQINAYALQSIYLVAEGKTLNEALKKNENLSARIELLKDKNIVKKYSGVSALILSDSLQKERINRWNAYWTSGKKQQLFATLEKEGTALGFKPQAFDRIKERLNTTYTTADQSAPAGFRKGFLDDFITEQPGKATVVTIVKVAYENRQAVYKEFENDADITVVDKQYLTTKFIDIVTSDFSRIALLTSVLVFVVLLVMYGRIELTLVSFIPMLISWIWIMGIMALLDIRFNVVNIIISALIFGLGDDYSLFIMDGLLQQYKKGKRNLSSFKSSIFLSAITTISGLGVLIFAEHPALRSIAFISIIGIVCLVLMSQVLIPFLFNRLITSRIKQNKFPWTFSGWLKSIVAFSYFVAGVVLLTIIGFIFEKINPFNKEKGKLVFHTILSRFSWSLMYIMGNVKKEIINPLQENFSKPAIVICNHQSFLDILAVIMLHPKLILFTNKWVWNSPVFGVVVRLADYYPVSQGATENIDLLAEKVRQGYSIMIFPEGTRSPEGVMQRFHKGAFYLAEKLHTDILPIVIQGTGYTMTKGDFLLKDGKVTLQFLPRITPENDHYGTGYSERTKNIGKYFRAQHLLLKEKTEQTHYFRERLTYNYLYKGPVLEWYLRVKLHLEKNYQPVHELLPKQGKLLDLGCGYGFMSYMLHFVSPERQITGIDYDEEKIDTANHCFDKNDTIHFITADAMNYPFEYYDGIIVADMLHYLQPDQQTLIIKKCILHLNPGGVLLIREGNTDMKKKHRGTRLTEFFSTTLTGFNKTAGTGLSFMSGETIKKIAGAHHMKYTEMDNTRYTSNIVYVLTHQEVN